VRTRVWGSVAVALTVAAAAAGSGAVAAADVGHRHDPHGQDLARARTSTVRFHDFGQAQVEGRFELSDLAGLTCIEDPGGAGGMGVHWVDAALVGDGEIDVTQPEALLYDPSAPEPRLLGVEYVVLVADWGADREPPTLFGHEFHLVAAGNRYGLPAFYELHAWIWHHNPAGMFEDWNPRIDC
jgi:hypothetical protein